MGIIQHDYVFATTCQEGIAREFADFLQDMVESDAFRNEVHKVFHSHRSVANNFVTLMMLPDGWNHGGAASNEYNTMRKRFLEWLAMQRIHPFIVSVGELGTIFQC